MKCLKQRPTYVLNFLLLIPFLVFPFTLERKNLEKIACETLHKTYPSLVCKGITFYGKRLLLPEGVYIFDIKKDGNSYLLEVVNAQTGKTVKLIPIRVINPSFFIQDKQKVNYGKRVKVIFLKRNIEVESSGILLESAKIGERVKVKVGKKNFYGRLKDENTVIVYLP